MTRIRSRWKFLPLLLALPSACFAWLCRDVPCFGGIHDDGVYFVCARALASGLGYRIASLPGAPFQTKYPPLFPLLLSLAWKLNPHYPDNLSWALALNWLAAPAVLWLTWILYRDMGLAPRRAWIPLAALALSPAFLLLASSLLSEMVFTALLLATLLLLDRATTPARAAAAGAMGALVCLTRSAGLPLLVAAAVMLWPRGGLRRAFWFAAAMLPAAAGWEIWVRLHRAPGSDPFLLYYTDYLAYRAANVDLHSLPVFVWRNAEEMLGSFGAYLLPAISGSLGLRIAAQVVAVAGIHGVVRLARARAEGPARAYALFAALQAATLLFWHYPSNERLLFPLAPLFLAGLLAEGEALAAMLAKGWRTGDAGQRAAAAVLGAAALGLLGTGIALQATTNAYVIPRTLAACRRTRSNDERAFQWIASQVPAGDAVLCYHDPTLYLWSGRQSMRLTLPPKPYYFEDRQALLAMAPQVPDYARAHGFAYVYWFPFDGPASSEGGLQADLAALIRSNPALERVYSGPGAAVFRLR